MKLLKVAAAATLAVSLYTIPSFGQAVTAPECVAPAQPGGGFDLTCRIAQRGLADAYAAPIQVTFMPGGIGAVAYNLFNTTRTDDPNAIVAFSTGSLLNIATGKFGEFSAEDVRWVATAGADFGAVVVKADSPFQTLDDVMNKLKTDGEGSVVMGAGGSVGSQDWMKAALLMKSVGLDAKKMRYVAFDGGGASIAALLGGSIEVYTGDVAEMKAHLDAGTMRILAVMAPERLPEPFAQFPTAKELGYDAEWVIMRGYYMGGDVSDEAYNTWVDAFQKAYGTEEWAKIQAEQGLFPLNMAGAEFNEDVKARVARLKAVAKEAGLIQ